jgi:hypothetical protein
LIPIYINAEILIYLVLDPYINAENCWDFLAVYLNHDYYNRAISSKGRICGEFGKNHK